MSHPWAETLARVCTWGWCVGTVPGPLEAAVEKEHAPRAHRRLCQCGPCHLGKMDLHCIIEEAWELWGGAAFAEEHVGSGCWLSPVPGPPRGMPWEIAPLCQSLGEQQLWLEAAGHIDWIEKGESLLGGRGGEWGPGGMDRAPTMQPIAVCPWPNYSTSPGLVYQIRFFFYYAIFCRVNWLETSWFGMQDTVVQIKFENVYSILAWCTGVCVCEREIITE